LRKSKEACRTVAASEIVKIIVPLCRPFDTLRASGTYIPLANTLIVTYVPGLYPFSGFPCGKLSSKKVRLMREVSIPVLL
jgi:hypothetical protein